MTLTNPMTKSLTKSLTKSIIVLLVLSVCLSLGGSSQADPALPMQSQPLSNCFKNQTGFDWPAVQQTALTQTTTQPVYKSNAVENITFSGYFQATDATARLGILSDDGADVFIDGQKVQSGYQVGQALPNLATSLHQLSFTSDPTHVAPDPSHLYFIQIVYSNTYLSGLTDIDGVTLFCYGDGFSIKMSRRTASRLPSILRKRPDFGASARPSSPLSCHSPLSCQRFSQPLTVSRSTLKMSASCSSVKPLADSKTA